MNGPATPIITFYSYKGGTGRSMSLANTAWILASNGARVLVVDWDLEAPGLHRFFHPFLPDEELRSSAGLIDFMWEFAMAALDPQVTAEPGWHNDFANIQPYAMSVECRFPGDGTIDLVPAGRQDQLYSTQVTSFDWNNFYEKLGGGGFLQARHDRGSHAGYRMVATGKAGAKRICVLPRLHPGRRGAGRTRGCGHCPASCADRSDQRDSRHPGTGSRDSSRSCVARPAAAKAACRIARVR